MLTADTQKSLRSAAIDNDACTESLNDSVTL